MLMHHILLTKNIQIIIWDHSKKVQVLERRSRILSYLILALPNNMNYDLWRNALLAWQIQSKNLPIH